MKKITLLTLSMLYSLFSLAQNSCAEALPVTAGTYTIDTINGAVIPNVCFGSGLGTAAEWYAYTPTQNYSTTITTDLAINICRDTRFQVYTGTCAGLVCVTGDDDSGIIACNSGNTNSYLSSKTFNVTAGTTYYIAFDNKWESLGFSFQISETPIVVPPSTPISYTTQTITTIPTGGGNYNICVVDMNGDQKDDMVNVSANNLKIHFQGATPGTFTVADFPISGTSKMPSWSLAAGDYNKDGLNDLILGAGNGLSVWSSNATGTAYSNFSPSDYIFCQRTNFADLNNDGNLDVFSCHDIAPNCYYLNDSAGNLTFYQSNVTPGAMNLSSVANGGGNYSTLFTDFDNDGDTDVFISKCSGPPCQLLRYDGNSVYTNISAIAGIDVTPIQTWSSGIADFDNDGDMDIIITASSGTHRYFRNNLDTTNTTEEAYTNITAGSGWDTNTSTNIDNVSYDFDNDGFVDVLGGGNKIMFNQGNSTFTPVSYSGISVGAIGDLNNDGFLDILNGNTVRYAVPNNNNWIKFSLQGIQSNSNGIGARIEIYGAFGKQIRDIRSGEGFRYMSSLNAHFGLGQATAVTQVVIKWPSGIVDTITNPGINQKINIVEGSTLSNESFSSSEFSLFPVPAKNILNIKSNGNIAITSAEIFDMQGRLIQKSTVENETINVQSLTNGTYIILLYDINNKSYTQKFTKE
jgi:hypothetical protein